MDPFLLCQRHLLERSAKPQRFPFSTVAGSPADVTAPLRINFSVSFVASLQTGGERCCESHSVLVRYDHKSFFSFFFRFLKNMLQATHECDSKPHSLDSSSQIHSFKKTCYQLPINHYTTITNHGNPLKT